MPKKLLLVDLENVHKVDLSYLDDDFEALIFVGANQNPPKAAKNAATQHKFRRANFHKIEGGGKNALDFHIAFQLGRTFEVDRATICFVLSKDKGFDPLVAYLNKNGLECKRIDSLHEIAFVCRRCNQASTIDLHGGKWCSICGTFASPPDPKQLPSMQPENADWLTRQHSRYPARTLEHPKLPLCGWCDKNTDMSGGIFDDGEWMCGECIASHSR